MSDFVGTFAPKAAAMEAAAQRAGIPGKLRYVTGSYLGIASANSKCPGSPNTTRTVLREVKAVGLCGQMRIDTHVTPGVAPSPGLSTLAAELEEMLLEEDCPAKLLVLEENKCSTHFDRALANAGTAAGTQSVGLVVGAAVSQCWTAAAHADGCGEGHIYTMPSQTWASPPYYAASMAYGVFQPVALGVAASPVVPAQDHNLTVFAARSEDGTDVVLRLLNANNVSVSVLIDVDGAGAAGLVEAVAQVQTLASPLFGTPDYDAEDGGWNSPSQPLFIAPMNSTWVASQQGRTYVMQPMTFVTLSWHVN